MKTNLLKINELKKLIPVWGVRRKKGAKKKGPR
jgi:hypothetical protein